MSDQDEIMELKARLAVLEARTAPKAVRPPPRDEGVRITELAAEVACALPNREEMRALADRMLVLFPELGPSPRPGAPRHEREDCERDWHKGFAAAFTALGSMRRMESPDHQRYASYFVDHCASWLRSHGIHADIGPAWTCAVIAWGDIAWRDWRVDGQVAEFGLNSYVGKLAREESWRRVLETGEVLSPTGSRLRMAPRSPARVY